MSITYEVSQKYLFIYNGETDLTTFKNKEYKKLLFEELIKLSPEFDQYLFDHREEILANKHAEFQNKLEVGKALRQGKRVSRQKILSGKLNESTKNNSPQCPTCKSYHVKQISGIERAGSVWAFGLFSKKINKSFRCENCGYTVVEEYNKKHRLRCLFIMLIK